MSVSLIDGLNHPARRLVLRKLHENGHELCPSLIVDPDSPLLSTVSYHAKILSNLGITRCTKVERKGNGWAKRYYASNVAGNELVATILADTEDEDASLLAADGAFAPARRKWASALD
jgi:DNA-binding transcriptional ArsR family regulator